MSKQDTHFFNMFSIVIGILVVVAILLFALSRVVAGRTQEQNVLYEAQYIDAVQDRLQPYARVAIAGQDNSALAIVEQSPAAGTAEGAQLTTALQVFEQACNACHGQGIAGAPRAGDAAAWAPRIAQGKQVLYEHAIKGYQGKAGYMPPKGGRADISDELVREAVDLMVERSQ